MKALHLTALDSSNWCMLIVQDQLISFQDQIILIDIQSSLFLQVPKYLSQQWAKATGRGEVGKIRICKYVRIGFCVKLQNTTKVSGDIYIYLFI